MLLPLSPLFSLLFLSQFQFVQSARSTKCRVKKRTQGLLDLGGASSTQTSPATNLPTQSYSTTLSTSTISTVTVAPTPTQLPPFDYATRKMRGVNLGGWFLMEVSPSWRCAKSLSQRLLKS